MIEEEKKISKESHMLMEKEELYSKQRSRAKWLKEGDSSTPYYFHANATQRNKRNWTAGILKNNDEWVTLDKDIDNTIIQYCTEIYASCGELDIELVLSTVQLVVMDRMNDQLLHSFLEEEVIGKYGRKHR